MEDRRRMGYSVQREILDEGALDEMAEKSESKISLSDKVKKSMRYWLYLYQMRNINICLLQCILCRLFLFSELKAQHHNTQSI